MGGSHGGLEVDGLHVLPTLLEQGDEVVGGQDGVLTDLILGHVDVADGATEAEDLLELEADGGLDVGDLLDEVVGGGDGGGELVGTVHTGSDDTGNGLDDGLGGEEGVEVGTELLDLLLVLVELLEVIDVAGVQVLLFSARCQRHNPIWCWPAGTVSSFLDQRFSCVGA